MKNKNNNVYIILSENIYVKEILDKYLDRDIEYKKRYELLEEFCVLNKKTPPHTTIYKNFTLGEWWFYHKKRVNTTNDDIYVEFSKIPYIKDSLDEYLKNKKTKTT